MAVFVFLFIYLFLEGVNFLTDKATNSVVYIFYKIYVNRPPFLPLSL